jgi:3-oxoacyl-[acyl-carrier-protein] synthase-1
MHCVSTAATLTSLEKAAILSIFTANKEAQIDLSSEKTIFILSTTKGNVDLLENEARHCGLDPQTPVYLWKTAKTVSDFFENPNTPIVVSNACISGSAAQIVAMRELEAGNYDYAVVAGVDFLSKFIISGFQSFKALSPELCRPFDKDRCGLNLGEAAATVIFSRVETRHATSLLNGAIRNDANHISAPSRTGEGSFRALKDISQDINIKKIAFINAHGTATPYNDAMEVTAIVWGGLENVPVNSLKAFFGHTLGAAGVLESIISIKALEENVVLKSMNFDEQDFENQINISKENHFSDKKYFIKMLSGFGGCNAALLFVHELHELTRINAKKICVNSCNSWTIKKHIKLSFKDSEEVTGFYRSLQVDYPKFFKMDGLSKLGFLASEMIFKDDENRFTPSENVAVVCFNRSSSLDIDTQYQETICDNENYFPSPSLFVYTLPNIVTGEIAIRNKFFGETSFYICKEFDAKQIVGIVKNTFDDKTTTAVLAAWIEHFEGKHEVFMALVESEKGDVEFTEEQLKILYNS